MGRKREQKQLEGYKGASAPGSHRSRKFQEQRFLSHEGNDTEEIAGQLPATIPMEIERGKSDRFSQNGHYPTEPNTEAEVTTRESAPTISVFSLAGSTESSISGAQDQDETTLTQYDERNERSEVCDPNSSKEVAKKIAAQYSELLEAPDLSKPIEDFIVDVTCTPDLQGVGLVVWDEPGIPTTCSIYSFSNAQEEARREAGRLPTATQRVTTSYRRLVREARKQRLDLPFTLTFFNTEGTALLDLIEKLPNELSHENVLGLEVGRRTIRHIIVAQTDATGTSIPDTKASLDNTGDVGYT